MAKAKAKPLSLVTEEDKNVALYKAEVEGLEYMGLKQADKDNKKREEAIKNTFMPVIKELGEQEDENHLVVRSGSVKMSIETRERGAFNPDKAERVLKHRGVLEKAQTRITIIEEEKVEGLFADGDLTEDDIAKMYDTKMSEAFLVEKNDAET